MRESGLLVNICYFLILWHLSEICNEDTFDKSAYRWRPESGQVNTSNVTSNVASKK